MIKEIIEKHAASPSEQVRILLKLVYLLAAKLDADSGVSATDYVAAVSAATE